MGDLRSQKRFQEDVERLNQLLVPLCDGEIRPYGADQLKVLNLACGECHEAEMLASFLRDQASGVHPEAQVDFVGLDIRDREISRAKERCRAEKGIDYRFLKEDGARLLKRRDLPEAFDVVFVRHQNYYLGEQEWHDLFEKSLQKLAPDGRLIITSYFEEEHQLARGAIETVGGELIRDIANPNARQLSVPGKRVDQRLAIFRRS